MKPIKDFQGKILHIDLIDSRHWVEEITDEVFSNWLGGRGLGCYLLWKNLKPGVDPLSMLEEYYRLRGWDESGKPLKALNLGEE